MRNGFVYQLRIIYLVLLVLVTVGCVPRIAEETPIPPPTETLLPPTPTEIIPTETPTSTVTPTEKAEDEHAMVEWDSVDLTLDNGQNVTFAIGTEKDIDVSTIFGKWGVTAITINRNCPDYEQKLSDLFGYAFYEDSKASDVGGVSYEEYMQKPSDYPILAEVIQENGWIVPMNITLDQVKRIEQRFVSVNDPRLYVDLPMNYKPVGYELRQDGTLIIYKTIRQNEDNEVDNYLQFMDPSADKELVVGYSLNWDTMVDLLEIRYSPIIYSTERSPFAPSSYFPKLDKLTDVSGGLTLARIGDNTVKSGTRYLTKYSLYRAVIEK